MVIIFHLPPLLRLCPLAAVAQCSSATTSVGELPRRRSPALAPLEAGGVDLSALQRVAGGATRRAIVLVESQTGERTVIEQRDSRVRIETGLLDRALLAQARALLVDGTDPEASIWAARAAREAGTAVFLDADSASGDLEKLLPWVDFPVVSQRFAEETGRGILIDFGRIKKRHKPNVNIIFFAELIEFILSEKFPPYYMVGSKTVNPAIPEELDRIARKATGLIPGEDYQTPEEVVQDLRIFLSGLAEPNKSDEEDIDGITLYSTPLQFILPVVAAFAGAWLAGLFGIDPMSIPGLFTGDVIIVSADDEQLIPTEIALEQNYPNPFNPSTSIKYIISSRQFVSLKVYDIIGNEIATLVNSEKPTGVYEVEWNASNVPSGVYFYQLKTGSFVQTKKMILLK